MMPFDTRLVNASLISKSISFSDGLSISNEAKFICEAQPPFRVIYVNRKWTEVTGYNQDEIVGGNLNKLQGPLTSKDAILHMIDQLRTKGYCDKQIIINYTKYNQPILCELNIRPIVVDRDQNYFEDGAQHIGYFLTMVTVLPFKDLHLIVKTGKENLSSSQSTYSSMSNLTDSNDSDSNSGHEEGRY